MHPGKLWAELKFIESCESQVHSETNSASRTDGRQSETIEQRRVENMEDDSEEDPNPHLQPMVFMAQMADTMRTSISERDAISDGSNTRTSRGTPRSSSYSRGSFKEKASDFRATFAIRWRRFWRMFIPKSKRPKKSIQPYRAKSTETPISEHSTPTRFSNGYRFPEAQDREGKVQISHMDIRST